MIIKGAKIINGSESLRADIRIEGEEIAEIAEALLPAEGGGGHFGRGAVGSPRSYRRPHSL